MTPGEPGKRLWKLGSLLAAARKEAGLSQRRLARRIERRHSIVSRWEGGSREPTAWDLERLRRVLAFDLDVTLRRSLLSPGGRRWSSRAYGRARRERLSRALAAARMNAGVSLADCVDSGLRGTRVLTIEAGVDPSLYELRLLCCLYGYSPAVIIRAAVLDKNPGPPMYPASIADDDG
jgi:transcriptional regulator with XRE-family HTH domain